MAARANPPQLRATSTPSGGVAAGPGRIVLGPEPETATSVGRVGNPHSALQSRLSIVKGQ